MGGMLLLRAKDLAVDHGHQDLGAQKFEGGVHTAGPEMTSPLKKQGGTGLTGDRLGL
jgi:hypothetical protein